MGVYQVPLTDEQFAEWDRAYALGITTWTPATPAQGEWLIVWDGARTDILRNAERAAQNTGVPQAVVTTATGDVEFVLPNWKIRAALKAVRW